MAREKEFEKACQDVEGEHTHIYTQTRKKKRELYPRTDARGFCKLNAENRRRFYYRQAAIFMHYACSWQIVLFVQNASRQKYEKKKYICIYICWKTIVELKSCLWSAYTSASLIHILLFSSRDPWDVSLLYPFVYLLHSLSFFFFSLAQFLACHVVC